MTLRRALTLTDLTAITVGGIVGADIYVASAITAGLLGPASLLAWLVAGVLATVIALTLAECARYVPHVGGPFAYVGEAFHPTLGFVAGWSLWVAELTALPVFAIAFTSYLEFFVPLARPAEIALRVAFLAALTAVNIAGVKAAGRFNDALTVLKLAPLLLMVVVGIGWAVLHAGRIADAYTPFAPLGLARFPQALTLIIWAYAGFELTTLPAAEVDTPDRTIPRAIAAGMAIVALFYMSTNFVVFGVVGWERLALSSTPLVDTGRVLLGAGGGAIMALGAVISVSGSDESDMLATSRLSYAMAADGLLPRVFARVHPRFDTPYVALVAQGAVAIGLSFVDRLGTLITFSVVNLAFAFLLCAISLPRLRRRHPEVQRHNLRRVLPMATAAICLYLLMVVSWPQRLAGGAVIASGLLLHVLLAPRTVEDAMRETARAEHLSLAWLTRRRTRFLGWLLSVLLGRGGTPPALR